MERFRHSMSNGNMKCPVGKSIFADNLPLKLFRATVANAATESLKSFYTLFDTYLDHMLAEFKPNRIVKIEKQKKKKGPRRPGSADTVSILHTTGALTFELILISGAGATFPF